MTLETCKILNTNRKSNTKWERKKEEHQRLLNHLIRKPEEEEFKPSQSISTKFLNKYTQISESQRKPWTSWTLSFMILLTELPLKDQNSLDSTKEEPSLPEKSNQLLSLSSPENSLDTLSLKEPKQSQNTFNNDFSIAFDLSFISLFS